MENEDLEFLIEVTAYHGSAYNFDKFDVKYIGKGEHGQAHGWGLYFSLGEGVAQGYRSRISSMNSGYQFKAFTYKNKSYEAGTVMYSLLNILANQGKKEANEKIDKILGDTKYISTHQEVKEYLTKIKSEFSKIKNGDLKGKIVYEEGNFYTVKIPELKYFLIEGARFKDQSPFVKKALKEMLKDNPKLFALAEYIKKDNYIARGYYSQLEKYFGSPKNASLALNKYGIVGIHYDGSIDKGCVVMFNNNDIKLTKKATIVDKSEPLLPDEMAIEEDPEYIKNIENPSKELQMLAIEKDYSVIRYITHPDKEVMKNVLDKNPNYLDKINNVSEDLIKEYAPKMSYGSFSKFINSLDNDKLIKELFNLKCNEDKQYIFSYIRFSRHNDEKIKISLEDIEKILIKVRDELPDNIIDNEINDIKFDNYNILSLFQKIFYTHASYNALTPEKKEINYSLTSEYRIDLDINNAPDDVRETCLNWGWSWVIPKLNEFTEKDLETFKNNYKLDYLSIGDEFRTFNFKEDCIISDEVLNKLFEFINKLENEGIHIYCDSLYKYMTIEELLNRVNNSSHKVGDFSDIMNHLNDDKKIEFLTTFIKTFTMKDVLDKKNMMVNKIYSNWIYFLKEIYNNNKELSKNDVFVMIYIKGLIYKRGKEDLIRVLEKASPTIQKYILLINVELMKYVNKVDERIQEKMIEKNPFNIRWINNPSKKIIDKVTKMNPMTIDYIRN